MTDQPTVLDLIQRSHREPTKEARNTLLEAIELADAQNDRALGYSARSRYVSKCHNEPNQLMMIAHYGWMLARHDEDPEQFPISLWEYKWVLNAAPGFAGVSREQLLELTNDLGERFEKAGASAGPAGVAMCDVLASLGDLDELETQFAEWKNATKARGYLDDCSACTVASEVYYLVTLDRHEEAIEAGEPLISQGARCVSQPHYAYGNLLDSARQVNDVDLASMLSENGLDLLRNDPDFTQAFGPHLRHLAVSRQLDKGLEVLRRIGPLATGDDEAMLSFSRGARLLLRLADDQGSDEQKSELSSLREKFDGQTEALAARFDERNGNTVFSDTVTQDDADYNAGWPVS